MDANERRARATHEATQWWNRLGIERPTEISKADRELFTQWLRESPLHVAELLRIAQVHDALERFKLWGEIETGAAGEPDNVVALREPLNGPDEAAPESGRTTYISTDTVGKGAPRSRIRLWAIAASICFVAVMVAWFALAARGQLIATELAERRQVMLDDGTVVQLEPETRLRVKFEDRNRYVALERGRALFRVAKDATRPFWVSTEHTSVRAVGTAFGVESGNRGVIVTVAEGKVAVGRSKPRWFSPAPQDADQRQVSNEAGSSATTESAHVAAARKDDSIAAGAAQVGAGSSDTAGASASEIFLTAGQQLTVQGPGAVERVRMVDAARALAWAEGQLVFENDTLADVVAEFNRYNRTQLHISDLQLAARRVSGVFEATDMQTLLAFIRQGGSEIRIRQTDEGIVIDSSR